MRSESLQRWSGLAAAVGGPLLIASFGSNTFWRFIQLIRVPRNFPTHPVVAECGLLLTAVGLNGLFRRLPPDRGTSDGQLFAIALFGILAQMVASLGLFLPLPDLFINVLVIGIMSMWIGIAGMGLVGLSSRALGVLSFAPLVVPATGLATVAAITSSDAFARNQDSLAAVVFFVLHVLSWVALGAGLWTTPQDASGPGLPA